MSIFIITKNTTPEKYNNALANPELRTLINMTGSYLGGAPQIEYLGIHADINRRYTFREKLPKLKTLLVMCYRSQFYLQIDTTHLPSLKNVILHQAYGLGTNGTAYRFNVEDKLLRGTYLYTGKSHVTNPHPKDVKEHMVYISYLKHTRANASIHYLNDKSVYDVIHNYLCPDIYTLSGRDIVDADKLSCSKYIDAKNQTIIRALNCQVLSHLKTDNNEMYPEFPECIILCIKLTSWVDRKIVVHTAGCPKLKKLYVIYENAMYSIDAKKIVNGKYKVTFRNPHRRGGLLSIVSMPELCSDIYEYT